ncbi:MAG: amino acid adenylation domain-containing protein [Chitinophagaceae bacterium]|nr:amino acid adenylation domain-containing protein [Chitinophagaceae bacterium]
MAELSFRENDIEMVITELRRSGIRLDLIDDNLKVTSSKPVLEESLLAKIRSNKNSIVSYLKRNQINHLLDPIPLAEPGTSYVLSSSQQRLWILSQFEKGDIAYNMPACYLLEGNLDINALSYSFLAVIERHESLRTVFHEDQDGQVYQIIHEVDASRFQLVYNDLRGKKDVASLVKSEAAKDAGLSFDLANGPLIRAKLYQSGDQQWVFSYVMHHIISDGWSMGVLIKELLFFYNSYNKGGVLNSLEPLKIQYKDYAQWQQKQLKQNSMLEHKSYWLNQFSGELPVLNIPGDQLRPSVKTYRGGVVQRMLSASESQKLQMLCRENNTTLFIGLLAAVNILLHKYSAQEDIIVGTPIAGRDHSDLKNQIGFYVNTLPIRSRFKDSQNYKQILAYTRQIAIDAYKHQLYPFDELLEGLPGRRDISRNPLFDIMVTLQDDTSKLFEEAEQADGLTVRSCLEDSTICKFDLTFTFSENTSGLHFSLGYNSDIYSANFIDQMARHFEQLLVAILKNPSKEIRDLDYLSDAEKSEILVKFNTPVIHHSEKNDSIIDKFEAQVANTPDDLAIVFEGVSLTYHELNQRSNQLSSYLKECYSIGLNDIVGMQLDRSEWIIISILAILKSGGVYVPIDSDYPQERIDYILEDSKCRIVINETELNAFQLQAHQYSIENNEVHIGPQQAAYIIYTSGSTGRPKGVVIEHKSISFFAANCKEKYDTGYKIVMPHLASPSFDISLFELLLPLLSGGTAIILSKDNIRDIANLCQRLQGMTAIHAVPTLMTQILLQISSTHTENAFAGVKDLFIGGDAVPTAVLNQMRTVFPGACINVLYGPTESTIFVTSAQYQAKDTKPFKGSIIGAPNKYTTVYVLDSQQQLLPAGVVGEIYIAGNTVARGYLNQPGLTAEKFIPDMLQKEGNIYRTGDTGKWLPNGTIEYYGRLDNQVKIRGYRIELGEIEVVMQHYPGIDIAVVIDVINDHGENELVMYVVSRNIINCSEIRDHLTKVLPAYMIPGHIIRVDHLPTTPNGKLDKKALKEMQGLEVQSSTDYVAPNSEIETKLVKIWKEILGNEKIGVTNNFFEAGGNSIKIIRLAKQVSHALNQEIHVTLLFQYPTIRSLVDHLTCIVVVPNSIETEDFDRAGLLSDLNKF